MTEMKDFIATPHERQIPRRGQEGFEALSIQVVLCTPWPEDSVLIGIRRYSN